MSKQSYSKDVQNMFPDGSMEVKPSENLIPLITAQIYSDPMSGWRELLSNAYQYAADAAELDASPVVRIFLDKKNHRIELHEMDSMGISLEDLRRILSNMGKSANTDSTRHGKYGMGLAAASCLSDSPVFEVCARNGDTYAMVKKDPSHYTLKSPPPKFEKPGMRIILPLKEEIRMSQVLEYTFTLARFWPVKTEIKCSEVIGYDYDKKEYSLTGTNIKEYVLRDQLRDKLKPGKDFFEVEIIGDGYHLYGGIGSVPPGVKDEILVQNMPIGPLPYTGLSYCLVNIYDTDKYEPAPDRERLGKRSMERLTADITRDVSAYLKNMAIGTIAEYVESPHKWLYSGSKIWDQKTRTVMEILDGTVQVYGRKPNAVQFKDLLGKGTLVYLPSFTAQEITTISSRIPNAIFIRKKAWQSGRFVEAGPEVTGVIDGLEYIKKNGISAKSSVKGYSYSRMKYYQVSEITDRFIRVPRERSLVDLASSPKVKAIDYVFIQDCKKVEDTPAKTLDEFVESLCGDTVNSSAGQKSTREIVAGADNTCWFDGKDSEYSLEDFGRAIGRTLLDPDTPDVIKYRVDLACVLVHGSPLETKSEHDDGAREMLIADLGIRFTGRWSRYPEEAARHMSEITNVPVREVYAHIIENLGGFSSTWEELATVHRHMLKLDGECGGLDKVGILQKWVETHPRIVEEPRQSPVADITEAVVKTCVGMMLDDHAQRTNALSMLLEPIFGKVDVKSSGRHSSGFTLKYDGRPVQLHEDHIMWHIIGTVGYHSSVRIKSFVQEGDSTTIVI